MQKSSGLLSKAARPAIAIRKEVGGYSSVTGTPPLPVPFPHSVHGNWYFAFLPSQGRGEEKKKKEKKIHKNQGCKCAVPFWPIEVSSRERMRQFDLEELVPIEIKTSMGTLVSAMSSSVLSEWVTLQLRSWLSTHNTRMNRCPQSAVKFEAKK